MPSIARSVTSLRIFGDALVPQEVTARLGATPTKCYRKGDVERTGSGKEIVRKTGMWLLEAEDKEPEDLSSQVAEILSRLTPDPEVWRALSGDFQVDLFCGLFMNESNEGFCLSPSTLASLAERGIEMILDVYAPDREISPTEPCPCMSGKSYAECCAPKSAT